MINKFLSLALCLTLICLSCNNKFAQETDNFNTYLSNAFRKEIPQNKHTYLLISTFRCSGCVENALIKISQKSSISSCNKITILSSDLSLLPDSLSNTFKVLLDKNSGYENIGIPIANIAIIKSDKGKIVKIRIINLDDTDAIVNEEF